MIKREAKPFSEESEKINLLILRYRDGDVEAGSELITKFTPLMNRYKGILWYGKFTFGDDVGRFLSFFGKDKKQVAELLAKSMRRNTEEDLDGLLRYCLLKTAKKYNKISAGFKFILKEEIWKLTKDIGSHRTTQCFDLNVEQVNNLVESRNLTRLATLKSTELNEREFVLFGSEMDGFKDLNEEDRLILKLAYLDKLNNNEISEKLKMPLNEVKKKRQQIRNTLKEFYT